ncbi:MAG: SDR family NAD(P)-dependent oxidoreductase, partial [Acidobacteriia bacterium]|nr:SDR family NAD(P)-dependent oxidoreductase [Terriglobia bacterium]
MHSFIKRDYVIRHATEADLERLCQLERLCWQHTRTSKTQIRSRLQQYPQGQFVLEKEGKVLGVIYSQRIASTEALMTCNAAEVHKLHQPLGPIIQLLAVNIDPQAQNAGYGDQLLEFMLQRCSLMTGIERVVGVTLCKNYNAAAGPSFEQYIQQSGRSQDPVLAFHQAHGAEVVKAIPGYRPQDHANMSNGVLVAYDILNRTPRGWRSATTENITITAETGVAKADEQQISQFILGEAAQLLGVSSGELDIDRPVMEMGLDSADLLKLGQQVEDKFGLKLGVGFFFEHSNIRKVIDYLITMLVAAPEASRTNPVSQITVTQLPGETALPAHNTRSDNDRVAATDIAIIGMSCKLPGGIETPVQLWQALAAKKCVISSFPTTRRPWPAHGDKPGIDQGGFVKDADAFDAPFFRMSRTEAEITDPQQRILLELAWACLEDAGILPDALKGSNTGVFIGASNCDYSRLIQEAELEVEAHHGTGSSLAVLANRLSYFFDFSGPSLLIDTACSSSLVALHTAIQSLRSGECATALVGGVNFICHPDLSIAYHKAGMLAPDGRCKVFDAKADGYVRSEGAVMLLLKPLSVAVAERDQIHAVIKGSAINHGGLAAGLTVPNPQKQSDLLIAAWQDAGIAAHDLTYIEAHGTGTSLGDPIEIQGIQAAYMHLAEKQLAKPCAIGSVKSNLGHLEPAAGIAGLLKVVLSIQHRQLPASINCDRLNPKIQLKDTPFFIQDQLREWNTEKPRLAAVSSFGSGGANAHVVVQEHVRDTRPHSREHDYLFVLSAASHDRLRIHAMRVIGWLEHEPMAANFSDAIYTWQVGRTAMKQRLAIKVKDHVELSSKLRQWLAGNSDVADVWSGEAAQESSNISRVWHTKSGQQLIDQSLLERNLEQLGILWASGIEIDWNKCYEGARSGENKPQRVSLPTYPFAKERYWINAVASNQAANGRSPAVLHPLLHSNTSTLSEQRFTSQFSGNEFFLADHVIKGSRVLPAVCYLEMARAAVMASATENASNDRVTIRLKNVVWVSPIIVDGPQRVHIGVYADEQGDIEYEVYSNVPGEAAGESSEVIHGQGRACLSVSNGDAGNVCLDWLALRAGCGESLDATHCYAAFSAMGIEYGPGHRGIRRLGVGRDAANKRYVLAEMELPGCLSETQGQYVLHPSVLDSALQASMGFALADTDSDPRSASGGNTSKPSLPFELEEIEILDRTPAHAYVYIRESAGNCRIEEPGPVKIQKFDIDICDENGHVSVRLRGFTSRVLEGELRIGAQNSATTRNNESLIATVPLVPRWDAAMPVLGTRWPSEGSRVLLVGGTTEQEQAIRVRYPDVTVVEPDVHDFQGLVERMHIHGAIEHVVWLVPASEAADVTDERLIHEQSQGVLGGLRLIKTLLRLGYETKNLGWTVVTHQTQAIRCDERIQPSHASVHGLIGSLAKEYPHWKVRLVDLPSMGEWPLDEVLGLPADGRGNALAYRAGEWYQQQLVPCEFPASQAMAYRHGGVYVVIGGAGGIGEVFSEHLIRNYQAKMVWIGRRELDAGIRTKLDRLSTLGPAPSYIRADATDREALARAYQKIKAQHGQIHGLVHAAIALADKSLAQMDEDRFKAGLAAKVDVSVRMAQVFAQEPMDCVLFFSSLLSFSKPAGQSNYLAGCTFADAFAHQLSQAWSCPVKIMNWGYWGSRGIVASDAYRARMAQNGVGSIEPGEGLAALEQLLSAPIPQLALAKAQPRVLEAIAVLQDQITLAEKQLPALGDLLSVSTNRVLGEPAAQDLGNVKDMQRLMGQLLFDQLRVLGLFNKGQGPITAWKEQSKLPALYDRWLDESLRVLTREGYVTVANGRCTVSERSVPDRAALWSEWGTRKGEWLKDATLDAQVRMVDATLQALPEILTGKRRATEILFPKSSMELVEGFYKGNPVADYFNAVLSDAVVEFVELRRKHDPSARIRIIEIGAGTGGTSEGLFKRLKPYEACIAEYCYTDISKAFLMHAEQAYGPTTPYLAYRLLNIERALESQGMEPGVYDLAVATNVLHATKNIRKTLRNAKGLLKQNGVLLLNEILGHSLFTHLTFGLLEGWWLSEDTAVRISGTPTLSPETWQRLLEGEGFQGVHFPAFASHAQGQQIIVAQSDGVIRQSRKEQPAVHINTQLFPGKEAATLRDGAVPHPGSPKRTTLALAEDIHLQPLRDKAIAALKKIVGQTIKLPVHEIDSKEEMEKYGIDSILIVSMVEALRSVFVHVTSTVFFEYRTIDALVDHFIATEEEAVRRWVGAEEPVAWEAPASSDQDTRNLNSASIVKASGRRRRNRPVSITSPELRHNGFGLAETHAEDIAIIGLSGRYPEADNIEAYWHNLREGKDCIIEVPKERWDWREYFSEDRSKGGRHYSKLGGFIAGVDEFDPRFFNIAPSEAKYIDPQERLFLEHAWMAVEDAGYTRAGLQATCEQDLAGQVGVYVGVMYSEYQLFNTETDLQNLKMGFAGNLASIANRVSYVLNLHGPSMTLDTMCSSSLTAIHVACQDLKQGRTSLAIAGGVNVSVHPNKYLMLSVGQFISSDGHCQSFGEDGDGFIPAEGVGAVVLKRLSEAERDGDHIYGIIRGSALNHGGKTNGYTVPSPQAQSNAISRALAESHIDARHISYVEAHGTGTKLGDPIEIAALSKAFQQHTQDTEFCLIGSVKSNIGHCESAAGIAGLTKILLQMQHQQIVPSLHSGQLNPHIDFAKSPFGVNQELRRWEQPEIDGRKLPRIAGISSFGAGGSNAHMIVEEYQAAVQAPMAFANVIIPLSARTAEQLKQKARELLDFVRPRLNTIDLAAMAYTLQVGREAMEERLGLMVSSAQQLLEKLGAYVGGEQGIEDVYQGQVKRNKEALSLFSSDG